MVAPRWRKVIKDIFGNKIRTLLVILTIAVGVFATGFVSISFDMILHDMDADYQAANPHSGFIYTSPFDEDLLPALQDVPGVGEVEGRSSLVARLLRPDGDKLPINVTTLPPIEEIQIDLLEAEDPPILPPLGKGEVYIERSAAMPLGIHVGDTLQVELSDGHVRQLRVAGIFHNVTTIPYSFTNQAPAYATSETIEWLGGIRNYNQVFLTVAEDKTDEPHVRQVAAKVADKLETAGYIVYATTVYNPGHHFASQVIEALGAMMAVLGVLSVLLSTFLVVNTINSLLSQHIRQIGIMKAIGATTGQVTHMYLVFTLFLGLVAFALATPLASSMAASTLAVISNYLNFDPRPPRLPSTALALELSVALLAPLCAAMVPVLNGARITVRDATSTYGLGKGHFGVSWLDRLLEEVHGLPRPLLISLRNTFRRKVRLLLTLSTLVLAGGIFIAVLNLRAAMDVAIQQTLGYVLSDVNVTFGQPYRLQKVTPMALSAPGVTGAEAWGGASAKVLTLDRQTSTEVAILAPPANSTLIEPTLTSGRWLLPGDQNALVIGNHLIEQRPELKTGDQITLEIDGKESTWTIVGIYRMAGHITPPFVYANYEYLAALRGQVAQATDLRITTARHDLLTQQQTGQTLEALYRKAGIQVSSVALGENAVAFYNASTDTLIYLMLSMAALIAVVGGLGLTSTMSLNVMERTREIGVMRAVGAADNRIYQIVITEGMMIGMISWVLGALLSIPIGQGLSYVVGMAFLRSPMKFVFALDGFLLWLVIVVILSLFASLLPARNASRLTVREILAYE